MTRNQSIWTLGMLALSLCGGAWAQDTTTPPASEPAPQQTTPQEPTPAYGQENAPPPISENPPLSGLDLPSLEPHTAPLSYIQPGATVSESAESNAGNVLGGDQFTSVSRGLGSLTLKRLWSNYDLAMDYMGGVAYYTLNGQGAKLLQQADVDQKITWKRGQLSLRDSFSYLPEGNFGGAYGSLGSQGIASLGSTAFGSFWGGSSLGELGLVPRMTNVALADVSENLTPKSAITAAAGYAFTHFYDDSASGTNFVGSSQTSVQSGYNRLLSAHTQVALVYGYQGFDFSVIGTAFHSHVIQGMYGHRISGRMDLLLGAGPQFTRINQTCTFVDLGISGCSINAQGNVTGTIPTNKIGVAAQARLRYKFTKTNMDLQFQRFETTGSGIFLGAESDIVRLSVDRPLSRVWGAFADLGYADNTRLQPGGAVAANSYRYGFVGGGLHRQFGRNFHGFATYQFNELAFDNTICMPGRECNQLSSRHLVTFGLDWTPRPIRID